MKAGMHCFGGLFLGRLQTVHVGHHLPVLALSVCLMLCLYHGVCLPCSLFPFRFPLACLSVMYFEGYSIFQMLWLSILDINYLYIIFP